MTMNQLRLARLPSGPPTRVLASVLGVPLLVASAAAVGLIAVSQPELYRGALAIALVTNLVVVGMKWPRAAALLTLAFLPFLALIRRLLIADSGFESNDPLLLVGPVVVLFLLYRLYVVEGRRSDDRLFKLVAALLLLTIVEVFNPFATGGFVTAVVGLLFAAVPLLWFFAGRQLGDERSITILLYGTVVVAVLVGIYGLLQTQYGTIASWDQTWIDINGYSALNVASSGTSNVIRPFSTFSSNQEYAAFLAIGVTVAAAFLLKRRVSVVVALPVLALALFLAGGRSSLVTCALAVVVILALMTRSWAGGFLVVVLGAAIAYGGASTFGPRIDRAAGLGGDAVVERNVAGILKPLDPSKSTVIGHYDAVVRGLRDGIQNPAGHGTGASSIAAKVTASQSRDSEIDISNAFINLGLAGGILYLVIVVLMFRTVFARYARRRDALSLAVAGLLVVILGQWLNGGLYAIAPLFWFLAGWATRPE